MCNLRDKTAEAAAAKTHRLMYFFFTFFIISYDFIFFSWCVASSRSLLQISLCAIKSQPNKNTQLKEMKYKNDKYCSSSGNTHSQPPTHPSPNLPHTFSNNNCDFTYSICPSRGPSFHSFPKRSYRRKKRKKTSSSSLS